MRFVQVVSSTGLSFNQGTATPPTYAPGFNTPSYLLDWAMISRYIKFTFIFSSRDVILVVTQSVKS